MKFSQWMDSILKTESFNPMQKLFGKHYLGLVLLIALILTIIYY